VRAVPEKRAAICCPGQGADLGVDKLVDPKPRAKSLASLEVGDGHIPTHGGLSCRHDEGRLADEVVGRIETVGPFGPLTLVVDGHAVSWDELGQSLSPYEGWQFVLRITDRFGDPRL
jgi:hypothetical protein